MSEHLQANPYKRSGTRRGYRNGYKPRSLTTRLGWLELRVPQDHEDTFKTEYVDSSQRNSKALVATIVATYLEGVSTRKVTEVNEDLSGTRLSTSTARRLVVASDVNLAA